MDWLTDLVMGTGVAHSIFVYSIVIALGVILGKVKILGISLGATFVLFVGLIAGHFQLAIDGNTLKFIQEFGLILFIFSIGLQVGPSFFQSFKSGGLLLNGLAMSIVALNIVVALVLYFTCGDLFRFNEIVGVLSGAVTNTPGLGAAQQALIETQGADAAAPLNEAMSMGYAAAYPLGVTGIILTMVVIRALFRINIDKESEEVDTETANSTLKPHVITLQVTNKLINNITVAQLHHIIDRNFVISRIKRPDGETVIPKSDTIINENNLMRIVISKHEEDVFTGVIGPEAKTDWEIRTGQVVSRRIVVTNPQFSGRKLGTMRLPKGFGLNVTRVNRAGLDLLASANLALQVGDRITVVGQLEDINRLAELLGNSVKRLNHPNLFTMFIGIFVGIIVGSIPIAFPGMTVPMKLGLAGGPLVVAILIGAYGYKIKLVTYTSSSASLMLRELGMCLFLASVGLAAGGKFVETVFTQRGALWVLAGFAITVIPLLVVGCVARGKFKLNYCTLIGLISGSTTDPPALAYANKVANNDSPAVAYSTVYPLTMFLRVITGQIIVLTLASL